MQLVATGVGREAQIGQRGPGGQLQGIVQQEPLSVGRLGQEVVESKVSVQVGGSVHSLGILYGRRE